MAEVEWIKIQTDIFSNPKIKALRTIKPYGNELVLIWVMLLTLAGKRNSGGLISLTARRAYTVEGLADELRFPVETVQRALDEFTDLDMISVENGFISVLNWCEYQNVEGMEKIREYNKLAQQRSRERRKAAQVVNDGVNDMSMTVNDMSSDCHDTDKIRKEKDKISDIDISIAPKVQTDGFTDSKPNIQFGELIAFAIKTGDIPKARQYALVAKNNGFEIPEAILHQIQ